MILSMLSVPTRRIGLAYTQKTVILSGNGRQNRANEQHSDPDQRPNDGFLSVVPHVPER